MAKDESEGHTSAWNAAIAYTQRIDNLQKALNASRYNLKAFNPDTGTFNYEIFINSLNGLFHEAWAKLADKEKIEGDKIYKTVQLILEVAPPVKMIRSERFGESSPQIDEINFQKLANVLVTYERKIKEYLDNHNLNAPNSDSDEGL